MTETGFPYDLDRVETVVKRIFRLGAPLNRLLEISDLLASLGYAQAAALRGFLQS
jgi:hypothetical protein